MPILNDVARKTLKPVIVVLIAGTTVAAQQRSSVSGTVLAHSPASTGIYPGSPSITLLPDGSYLATHDLFGNAGPSGFDTCVYGSTDHAGEPVSAALPGQSPDAGFDVFTRSGIVGIHSDFHGFDCCEFFFEGRTARIVRPRRTADGRPWIWRARFWEHEPQTEVALLQQGFHVAFCDVAELYGNPQAIGIWDRFYTMLVRAGLSTRPALEGLSRGGIYIYRWAAAYPDRVACVYADAPVLDVRSWPGGRGRSKGNPEEWERLKRNFGLQTEEDAAAFNGSPLDLAEKIARAGFPMLHICGDADIVVPPEENTDPFERRVLAAGGVITVIRKPGVGHHPHSLTDPQPIVDFIVRAVRRPCK